MRNKTIRDIKQICFSKETIPFHINMCIAFVLLNAITLRTLFSPSDDLMDAGERYTVILALAVVGIFIALFLITPTFFKKRISQDETEIGVWSKILAVWVSLSFYIILQMLLFGICSLFSSEFTIPIIKYLYTLFALCELLFVWVILCAYLYFLAKSVFWYFIGFLTLNLAPVIIGWGCCEIYNINPLMPNTSFNYLSLNIFALLTALLIKPIVFLSVSLGIIGGFVLLKFKPKKRLATNLNGVSVVYRAIVIFLISLSCGFLISTRFMPDRQITVTYILVFTVAALSIATVLNYLTFRRNKPFLKMGINVLALTVSSALILGAIPAKVQKEAYALPNEEIESVKIFLDSIETFEIDEYQEECVALHRDLLQLFYEHTPKENGQAYEEPECIADLWEEVYFSYKLKNGETFFREYRNLNDSAFDKFYIDLLQSDMYRYSLKKTQMENPQMRYSYYGNDNGDWCELPKESVSELIETYCEELGNADVSAFYEEYETIGLIGVYETGNRFIYLPKSFTKTRNLAKMYLSIY